MLVLVTFEAVETPILEYQYRNCLRGFTIQLSHIDKQIISTSHFKVVHTSQSVHIRSWLFELVSLHHALEYSTHSNTPQRGPHTWNTVYDILSQRLHFDIVSQVSIHTSAKIGVHVYEWQCTYPHTTCGFHSTNNHWEIHSRFRNCSRIVIIPTSSLARFVRTQKREVR